MVFIMFKTNKILTLKQQRELKETMTDITLQYCKDDIMIQFETSQVIYLNKKMKDCVKLNCIFDNDIKTLEEESYINKLGDIIADVTSTKKEDIFVSIILK